MNSKVTSPVKVILFWRLPRKILPLCAGHAPRLCRRGTPIPRASFPSDSSRLLVPVWWLLVLCSALGMSSACREKLVFPVDSRHQPLHARRPTRVKHARDRLWNKPCFAYGISTFRGTLISFGGDPKNKRATRYGGVLCFLFLYIGLYAHPV